MLEQMALEGGGFSGPVRIATKHASAEGFDLQGDFYKCKRARLQNLTPASGQAQSLGLGLRLCSSNLLSDQSHVT